MSDKEFSDNCSPLLTYCTTASDDASSDEDEFVDTGGSRIVKPVGVARELGDEKKEFTITSDGLKPTSSGLHVVLNPVGISVTPLNLSSGASNASETDQSSGNSSRVGSAAPSHKGSPDCSGVVTEDENGHGSDKGYEAESETSRKVSSDKLVFGSVPLVKSKLSEVSVPEKISSEDEFGCDVSDFFGSGGDGNLPPSAHDDVGVVVQTFQRMQLHGLLNEGLVGESTGLGGDVIMPSDADVGNVDEAVEGIMMALSHLQQHYDHGSSTASSTFPTSASDDIITSPPRPQSGDPLCDGAAEPTLEEFPELWSVSEALEAPELRFKGVTDIPTGFRTTCKPEEVGFKPSEVMVNSFFPSPSSLTTPTGLTILDSPVSTNSSSSDDASSEAVVQ
ncbi:hypothetical protein OROMI_019313 [Orobanche minor]